VQCVTIICSCLLYVRSLIPFLKQLVEDTSEMDAGDRIRRHGVPASGGVVAKGVVRMTS